jgi:hypothetical protein
MKTSRVQLALKILKDSVDGSPGPEKGVPKPEPKKSRKVTGKSKKFGKA